MRMEVQEYLQETVNRVLVVVYGTRDEYQGALKYAAGLCRMFHASLDVVYPLELPLLYSNTPTAPGISPALMVRVWDVSKDEADRTVAYAKRELEQLGLEAQGRVLEVTGAMGVALAKMVGNEFDLVVVPETKVHGLERLLRKDMAVEIIRSINCPVVVVDSSWDPRHRRTVHRASSASGRKTSRDLA